MEIGKRKTYLILMYCANLIRKDNSYPEERRLAAYQEEQLVKQYLCFDNWYKYLEWFYNVDKTH